MIDPNKITNYKRDGRELEEFLIFSICVANKQAKRIAPAVDKLLKKLRVPRHYLAAINKYCRHRGIGQFAALLHSCGITPHNQKADFLRSAALANLDLLVCSFEDLMGIKGVSHKTAHFFLTHSREGYDYPILDTHILHFLRDCGVDAPMSTPTSAKRYKELADEFMRFLPDGVSVADFDLYLWKKYSSH